MDSLRSRRRNNPAGRRSAILTEAVRLLAQRGYYRFTVEELAQRSGVSKGGLLHHFSSKQQLLIDLLDEFDRRAANFIHATTSESDGPADMLRGFMAYPVQEPELCRLYSVLRAEALDEEHPAHPYFRRREADALAAFAHLVGGLVQDPFVTARQLHALSDGLILQWLASGQCFDLEGSWLAAIGMLVPALGEGGSHRGS